MVIARSILFNSLSQLLMKADMKLLTLVSKACSLYNTGTYIYVVTETIKMVIADERFSDGQTVNSIAVKQKLQL